MDHFNYVDGWLHAEDVPLTRIAEAVGTPVYVYSAATLTRHFNLFRQALDWTDHLVCFAVKSNSNLAVLKLLGDLGAGMDIVSGGEYARAKAAGVPGERIVFSGVGKLESEMRMALEGGIRQFNVESEPELELLSRVAAVMDLKEDADAVFQKHLVVADHIGRNHDLLIAFRLHEVEAFAILIEEVV